MAASGRVPEASESFGAKVAAAVAGPGRCVPAIDPSRTSWPRGGSAMTDRACSPSGCGASRPSPGWSRWSSPRWPSSSGCGSAGVAALESVLDAARSAGLLAIADAKRGDIGSTMEAYARAWLDPDSPLRADAVTAAPYLGLGALQPAFDLAGSTGRGVLVVVPGAPTPRVGRCRRPAPGRQGPAVEDMLLAGIAELNGGGAIPSGTVGAVVGATLGPSAFGLADLGGVILAPGVGAQGGTAAGVGALFGECPPGSVLASSSRSLLAAGPDRDRPREAAMQGQGRDGRRARRGRDPGSAVGGRQVLGELEER